MKKNLRVGFFNMPKDWHEQWQKMPEFHQEDLSSFRKLIVHFLSEDDVRAFSDLVKQRITQKTKSLWYPEQSFDIKGNLRFKSSRPLNPKYPVYIISKGRWKERLTVRALERMKVPFKLVIEPQEYKKYAAVVDSGKILQLPFSNLGKGSIPARNWVWDHAIKTGASRHWILDDNIRSFHRLWSNRLIQVADGTVFRVAEDFIDRYENVAMAGFNYFMFIARKFVYPPYYLNTRVYSCILLRNDLSHRWRGRYNEDTDLSIRFLKDGFCTILFNAFTADKITTMKMKGGNTDELYQGDGRLLMAESLQKQHPDIVTLTRKWGRWQHHVDYSGFKKNRLLLKDTSIIQPGSDNYGMKLVRI